MPSRLESALWRCVTASEGGYCLIRQGRTRGRDQRLRWKVSLRWRGRDRQANRLDLLDALDAAARQVEVERAR